jgi:hypothetical protein
MYKGRSNQNTTRQEMIISSSIKIGRAKLYNRFMMVGGLDSIWGNFTAIMGIRWSKEADYVRGQSSETQHAIDKIS